MPDTPTPTEAMTKRDALLALAERRDALHAEQEAIKHKMLGWHQELLTEAYARKHLHFIRTTDLQRLVDDLLDAAIALEECKMRSDTAALRSLAAMEKEE